MFEHSIRFQYSDYGRYDAVREVEITNAATPNFTTQPANQTVNVGDSAPLSVAATMSDGGTLSYQWYSNTTTNNSGGTAISGGTSARYAAPTATAGTTYYFVVVTNTNSTTTGSQTATGTSSVATVKVNALTPVPVDTLPPVTNAVASSVYGPDPVYNFHRSDITLALTATDSGLRIVSKLFDIKPLYTSGLI